MKRLLSAVNVGVLAAAAFAFAPFLVKETRSAACSTLHVYCTTHTEHVVVTFTRLT